MTTVAGPELLGAATSLQIGAGTRTVGPIMVRKMTPSQLRGEQLKKKAVVQEVSDESSGMVLGSLNNGTSDIKNVFKQPRYIDTRVDEVYPVKKSRLRTPPINENTKEKESTMQPNTIKNLSVLASLAAKTMQTSAPEKPLKPAEVCQNDMQQDHHRIERCSQSIFRSVTELSSAGERSSNLAVVDMNKALKGLFGCEASGNADLSADPRDKFGNPNHEYQLPGKKVPLDFTLKTQMRMASNCSVNWIHRSIMCSTYNGMPKLRSPIGNSEDSCISWNALTSQILSPNALNSWVYPQSILPSSIVAVMTSSSVPGEVDFFRKRMLAWEDSFRNLYYLLRKNICNIFYVCTQNFVVMFTNNDFSERSKGLCSAYISQSTRGLRSLLRENDICFSMPLCYSKIEQVNTEDLVELSEIEKQNLGQTRLRGSFSDVDDSPQSLLALSGNKNVHRLYDLLLNYRSSLTFLSCMDVPLLCSPVPFQNAAVSAPEIRCVEMKRVDRVLSPEDSLSEDDETVKPFAGCRSTIEIKDACLPPWIICRVCTLLASEGWSFDVSFTTEHTSIGLNAALGPVQEKSDTQAAASEGMEEARHAFGIPGAVLTSRLSSGFLKNLKYVDGSYTAHISAV